MSMHQMEITIFYIKFKTNMDFTIVSEDVNHDMESKTVAAFENIHFEGAANLYVVIDVFKSCGEIHVLNFYHSFWPDVYT